MTVTTQIPGRVSVYGLRRLLGAEVRRLAEEIDRAGGHAEAAGVEAARDLMLGLLDRLSPPDAEESP